MPTEKEVKYCPECGHKTNHAHVTLLGVEHFICPRCCPYRNKEPCKNLKRIEPVEKE